MKIRLLFDKARHHAANGSGECRASCEHHVSGVRPVIRHLQTYEVGGRVPVIHASALVHETAVLIGDVSVGADCYIGPQSVCRADQGSIVIERGTSLQDCCVVHTRPQGRVVVGARGQIGHGAMLHGCTIGRNVLIGMGAIILDDAVIEDDAMVGAATLVTGRQRVPARMLVRGNPGKVIREVTAEELESKHEITMHYVAFAASGVGIRRACARIVTGADSGPEWHRQTDADGFLSPGNHADLPDQVVPGSRRARSSSGE
jgi:phenylacetic acid degradation protein